MPTPCYKKVVYGPTADVDPVDTDLNVELPLPSKHKLTEKIIYGDDETQVLYKECTLHVETIIYNATITSTNASQDVELEVKRIKRILGTPGLKLRIYPVGLGESGVINGGGAGAIPDLKGGPYPQDIEVQPFVTNKAIMVRWSVMYRIKDCDSFGSFKLLQYNVEEDMDVDDDGNMVFTVHITYQARDPITDADLNGLQALSSLLVQRVNKSFHGMRRKSRTSFSRDKRIMSVRLVYTELPHDNALYPYTSNIQVTDTLESTLLASGQGTTATAGFYKWKRVIDATIRLSPRIHKRYAWLVLNKILEQRFSNLRLTTKTKAALAVQKPTQQVENNAVQETSWFLPLRMRLSEEIYSREIKVGLEYIVCTSLDKLFESTGLFERVDTSFDGGNNPNDLSDQWKEWQASRDRDTRGYFRYSSSGVPIVYAQCSDNIPDHQVGPNALKPEEQVGEGSSGIDNELPLSANAYPDDEEIPPEYTWVDYFNEFEIIEQSNNVYVQYLEQPADDYYKHNDAQGAYVSRNVVGMTLNGKNTNAAQAFPPTVLNRGSSKILVKMTGHAKRAYNKIPTPFVISIGGKQAVRVSQRVKQKQIATGDTPVYMSMWETVYAVIGGDIHSDDVLGSIRTTGASGYFT